MTSSDEKQHQQYVLHTPPGSFRSFKILIAAEYAGIPITIPDEYDSAKVAKLSPTGRPPLLVTPSGSIIFESGAAARYLGKLRAEESGLMGRGVYEAAEVDNWTDFASREVELPASVWVYPVVGYMPYHESARAKAKSDLSKSLSALEAHLSDGNKSYLVGSQITLADIAVASALIYPFKLVCDKNYLKPYKNVLRWFRGCVEEEQFRAVIGEVTMCREELTAPGQFKPADLRKEKKETKQ